MNKTIVYKIGDKKIFLNRKKALNILNSKKIINGKKSIYFNILPLKYKWAYDLYKIMKANHWEPEDIIMQKDIEQWHSVDISESERWIIKMGIGYFSAAEGMVGDNILHVIRNIVTASEIKLVLGRHVHEENIHADSLVYMISSLGINPHECEEMYKNIKTIKDKNMFLNKYSAPLRKNLNMNLLENQRKLAKNIFVYGQCLEGTQFFGLFGMILSLYRQNKFTGIGQMFRYTLRDESNHIKLFKNLFLELIKENSEILNDEFQNELIQIMKEAILLEKNFIKDCLPINSIGLSLNEFCKYIDYIGNRRLKSINLPEIEKSIINPLPWLSELMDLSKEQNFFEGTVTEYQKSSSLELENDSEL